MKLLRAVLAIAFAGVASLGASSVSAQTADQYRPVVQVMSYDLTYNEYPQVLGWGSASVVDSKGLLVSNNHVVMDEQGQQADAFAICVTTSREMRPDCRYTAHVLARDEIKDVSVLRIDSVDVFGQTVDFAKFSTLDIAEESELPANQASVTAIGYPWIGADTVSETTGVVSGTIEYNGATYIKSDAIIAGGNSGGALVDVNGQLVGIPTFTIGSDSSLGYALWIGEARKFISDSASIQPVATPGDAIFRENLRFIETANDNGKVDDPFVSFSYSSNYELQNYVERTHIQLASTGKNESDISGVSFDFIATPKVDDKEFLYLLESQGFYSRSYNKLKKKTIGGKTFYEILPKSGPDYSGSKVLVGRVNDSTTAIVNIQAPFYDPERGSVYEAEYEKFISTVSFKGSDKRVPAFRIPDLGVSISPSDSIAYSAYYGFVTGFLGNLHESFSFSATPSEQTSQANTKTFDEYVDYANTYGYAADSTRIKMGNVDGLVSCNSYYYSSISKDESGKDLPNMKACSIELYKVQHDDGKPYAVSVTVTSTEENLGKNLDRTYAAVGRILGLPVDVASMPNPAREEASVYSDIADQGSGYKKKINWLVNHDLLPKKSMLLPEQAVTWGEFLDMYLRFMYNVKYPEAASKCANTDYACRFATVELSSIYPERVADEGNSKKTMQDVFASLGIEYNKAVDAYFDSSFEQVMLLEVAGVDTSKLSFQTVWDLWKENKKSAKLNERIKEVENAIYKGERILDYSVFSDYGYYETNCSLTQNSAGIIRKNCAENTDKVRFNASDSAKSQLEWVETQKARLAILNSNLCTMGTKEYSTEGCLAALNANERTNTEKSVKDSDAITVLSRAGAIDWLLSRMDFGLFDEKLAEKKSGALQTDEEDTAEATPTEVTPMK
jgi:S1-C subfamily serine protease